MAKLQLAKFMVTPHFILIDDDGKVVEEVTSQPIPLYPGKYMQFATLEEAVTVAANLNTDQILQLIDRKLF